MLLVRGRGAAHRLNGVQSRRGRTTGCRRGPAHGLRPDGTCYAYDRSPRRYRTTGDHTLIPAAWSPVTVAFVNSPRGEVLVSRPPSAPPMRSFLRLGWRRPAGGHRIRAPQGYRDRARRPGNSPASCRVCPVPTRISPDATSVPPDMQEMMESPALQRRYRPGTAETVLVGVDGRDVSVTARGRMYR